MSFLAAALASVAFWTAAAALGERDLPNSKRCGQGFHAHSSIMCEPKLGKTCAFLLSSSTLHGSG
eukprot:CAMPEP_0179480308 /NCGR_PEP_ID=MMETSP0799-20121207/58319_1 /TAXON_ID=46947 /ORGANISM="Geminigera cryophila, Strain CCMP2564" /LENGTH=64 /DNA_ID=CAMNT_0021292351 /DNA_START=99 /DNA_END=289 /DNA_ORIENTATION=+